MFCVWMVYFYRMIATDRVPGIDYEFIQHPKYKHLSTANCLTVGKINFEPSMKDLNLKTSGAFEKYFN